MDSLTISDYARLIYGEPEPLAVSSWKLYDQLALFDVTDFDDKNQRTK